MSAHLGPEPLPTTIDRADVGEHRSLFCSSYDVCLDRAAHENWASWTCARCARFQAPRGARRDAAPERTARQGNGAGTGAPDGHREGGRSAPPAASPRRDGRPGGAAAHSIEDDAGALRVRLEAPCMAALFVEAARAVAELVQGPPLEPASDWADEVSISAPDAEHLLMAWIAELVSRSQRAKVRFTEIDIVYLSDRRLVTSIRGVRLAHVQTRASAATYRDPCLVERREGVTATPVLEP